jgi:hypothetical protein
MRVPTTIVLAPVIATLPGSGGSSPGVPQNPPPPTTRAFDMGFTTWSYDATATAVNLVYPEISARGLPAPYNESGSKVRACAHDRQFCRALDAGGMEFVEFVRTGQSVSHVSGKHSKEMAREAHGYARAASTRLIEIALWRSSPLWGALRAPITLTRFIEQRPPPWAEHTR